MPKLLLLLLCLLPGAWAEDITCEACKGSKVADCLKCKDGNLVCPGKCLKKETPGWHKRKIAGFSDDDIWMEYRGGRITRYWSQRHIGEIIVIEGGDAVNKGKCPTCAGTTRVACKTCGGDHKITCAACGGDGLMNEAERTAHRAEVARREKENTIELADGTSIKGRIIARTNGEKGERVMIKKETGEMIDIPASDLKAAPEKAAPAP